MGDKEAKTLKEWFGDATRGDGRRFKCHDWMTGDWFEPIFLAKGDWVGIDSTGDSFQWGECEDEFELYTGPKKTECQGSTSATVQQGKVTREERVETK